MLKNVLLELGLTENEGSIYLALLKFGPQTASEVSEKTGLHRSYIYDALERLMEKNVVNYKVVNKKKYFEACKPGKLADYLKQQQLELEKKQDALAKALPEFSKYAAGGKEEVTIEIVKGKQTTHTVLQDIFKTLTESKGENLGIGVNERQLEERAPLLMHKMAKVFEEKGVPERMILKEGDEYLFFGKTTKYRWVPKQYFSPVSTLIYDNKVALLMFGMPDLAVVLEGEQVADAFRKQFEVLWKFARPAKKQK